jgi:predicted dienelactone hydrolase
MGCTEAIEGPSETEWQEPGVSGDWSVGTRADVITGTDGLELEVQTWYPTQTTEGTLHLYGGLYESAIALSTAVPDCSETRPVLAFSHGSQALNYQSYFLTEYLASRGWVIVAPEHRGNTVWNDSEDKVVLAFRRPFDIRDTVDWLFETLASPGGVLDGCVDPEAGYAISGHSFGGYTTLAVAGAAIDLDAGLEFCATSGEWMCGDLERWAASGGALGRHDLSDDRVWAALPMAHAGHEILFTGLPEIDIPVLILGGGQDPGTTIEGQAQPSFDALSASEPRHLGEIERAGHFAFSDACTLLSGWVGDECSESYIDPQEAHHMIRVWTSAFLQQARGRTDACDYLPGDFEGVRWETRGD